MDERDAIDEEAASAEDNGEEGNASDVNDDLDDGVELDESDEGSESEDLADEEIDEEIKVQQISGDDQDEDNDHNSGVDGEDRDVEKVEDEPRKKKRKLEDHLGNLDAASLSLCALKRLAGIKFAKANLSLRDGEDGFLSNEDFQRIKELKARKEAKQAFSQHGLLRKNSNSTSATFRIPSSEELSTKRLDPSKLEAHIKSKLSKEERLALVRAGREDRGQYQARAAVKQKKTGGLSNRQKQHKKVMPLAAKKHRAACSRQEKKQQQKRKRKQFKGRKAWNFSEDNEL